jgi:uncharacterized protein YndB with AHSA1/START domain
MKRAIVIERVLAYPVEHVWRALTDRRALAAWLMENDFEPRLHHAFTFRMKPQRGWDGLTHCEVIELEPPRRLAYTYRGEATGEKAVACAAAVGLVSKDVEAGTRRVSKGFFTKLDTVLRLTLTPEYARNGTERTRLRLEHEGFQSLQLVAVSFVMEMGWKRRVLPRLDAVLARLDAESMKPRTA